MRRVRMPTLFLAAVVPCLSAAGFGTGTAGELKTFSVLPGDTVIIQNDYGHIRIEPSAGSSVEVHVEKRSGLNAPNPPVVVTDKRSDKIFLYCFFADSPGQSVDIVLRAPTSINAIVWGANPAIDVRGLEGSVRLQTLTGDTVAENLTGSTGGIGGILGDIILGRRNPTRLPGPSTYPTPGRAAYNEARLQLQQIADQTGGRMYAPQAIDDLNCVYSEIADDLRIQYWLGYTSSNHNADGSWRAQMGALLSAPAARTHFIHGGTRSDLS